MNRSVASAPASAPSSIVDILASSALFGTLENCALMAISAVAEVVQLPSGAVLFHQGDAGDSLYIVGHGRLRVEVNTPQGGKQRIGEVGRGESVGEMAILAHEPRSATVFAIRNTELIKLSQDSFEALIVQHPQALRFFAQMVSDRLRQAIRPATKKSALATLAILPLGLEVPALSFAESLRTAMTQYGSACCLTRDTLQQSYPEIQEPLDGIAPVNRALTQWLNEQEDKYCHLIYVADSHWSLWTQHCIQQADCILLVARDGSNYRQTPFETAIARYGQVHPLPQMELVLLHGDRQQPPLHTRKWLAARTVKRHHHICIGDRLDFERLARFMTGRTHGLVLGGGGARAFAHIGVLRALQEANIPIDLIGGTSMGAILAAQYAAGWDHTQMLSANKQYFQNAKTSLMDYTLPLISLIKGQQFIKIIREMFGHTHIEDLWLSYFCVSSNLNEARVMVHPSGQLQHWLCASISIPGMGPPLCSHRNLLVDGGVLNNLPVDIMLEHCQGSVIAVDVGAEVDLSFELSRCHLPSPWQILWQRLNPFVTPPQYPLMTDILWRAATLGSKHAAHLARVQAALFIQPPLQSFKVFDWHSLDTVYELGYRCAQEKIATWQASQS